MYLALYYQAGNHAFRVPLRVLFKDNNKLVKRFCLT